MRDEKAGTYNGEPTYCTVNAYGDCPYCDQCNICHSPDPMKDCDEFAIFFGSSWDYWLSLDESYLNEPHIEDDLFDEEVGFDPYLGQYTDDC